MALSFISLKLHSYIASKRVVARGNSPLELLKMSENVVSAIEKRNINLKPTESVKTTHSKGCST